MTDHPLGPVLRHIRQMAEPEGGASADPATAAAMLDARLHEALADAMHGRGSRRRQRRAARVNRIGSDAHSRAQAAAVLARRLRVAAAQSAADVLARADEARRRLGEHLPEGAARIRHALPHVHG